MCESKISKPISCYSAIKVCNLPIIYRYGVTPLTTNISGSLDFMSHVLVFVERKTFSVPYHNNSYWTDLMITEEVRLDEKTTSPLTFLSNSNLLYVYTPWWTSRSVSCGQGTFRYMHYCIHYDCKKTVLILFNPIIREFMCWYRYYVTFLDGCSVHINTLYEHNNLMWPCAIYVCGDRNRFSYMMMDISSEM